MTDTSSHTRFCKKARQGQVTYKPRRGLDLPKT